MSLEDQIGRLANAVAMQEQNSAVAEIIRQRDDANSRANVSAREAAYYCDRRDDVYKKLEAEKRRSAALRGVITRMKKAGRPLTPTR
jgi:hypothetical protein